MVSAKYLVAVVTAVTGVLAAPAPVREPTDFVLSRENATLVRRQDYDQNYQTGGDVQYSSTDDGYSVTFNSAADFVVGKGWRYGTTRNINFDGSFSASAGHAQLTVYGWTRDPLVEYYIMEDYTSYSGGTQMGSFDSDGATYDVYQNTRVDAPSIDGTATFQQYISVRQATRTSGTVTMTNHFDQWAALGMDLGSYEYQVMATEGYNSATGETTQTISGA